MIGSEARKHIGLAAEGQLTSCSVSRCITARERRRAPRVCGNTGAEGARPSSFVVLCRTTQLDIAVQRDRTMPLDVIPAESETKPEET
jgi:hypothetical protein